VAKAKKKLERTITSRCKSRSEEICCSNFILLHTDDPRAALGGGKKAGTDGDPGKGLQRLAFESTVLVLLVGSDKRNQTLNLARPIMNSGNRQLRFACLRSIHVACLRRLWYLDDSCPNIDGLVLPKPKVSFLKGVIERAGGPLYTLRKFSPPTKSLNSPVIPPKTEYLA
jgi:hypothetical protein